MENLKVSKATIVRLIAIVLVVVRMISQKLGYSIPMIDESEIAEFVEMVVEIGAIACAYWYNNSFSEAAKKADEYMKELKGGE